jgi:hypothetical protein
MSLQITETSPGLVSVKISGKLSRNELTTFLQSVPQLLRTHGDFNLLVLADEFDGFGPGNWATTSPQTKFDKHIRRIAVVCDPKWSDLAMMFTGKGLRPAEIESFPPSELAKARAWLSK